MGYGCWPKGGRPLKWLRLWRESLIPSETGWTTFAKAGPKVWSLSRLGVPPRLEPRYRHQRMVERRIPAARFPAVKSLDTFDFPDIPSVNKPLVMELARCEYIQRRENVTAVGNSGTGKTHIALGLGLAACQRGMVGGLHRRRRPGARVDGGQRREAAAQPAAESVPPRPADHRRTGLRAPVPYRGGTALPRLFPLCPTKGNTG